MNGLKELFDTGKGVLAVAVLVAATILAFQGTMPIDTWKSTAVWVFGAYATASALRHGLVTASTMMALRRPPAPPIQIVPAGVKPDASGVASGPGAA